MQTELNRFGFASVDRIFNSQITVRCPYCGKRFEATIQRVADEKDLHPIGATCPGCGKVEIKGSVVVDFHKVYLGAMV